MKRDDVHHAKICESLITIEMASNHEFIKKLRRSTRLQYVYAKLINFKALVFH